MIAIGIINGAKKVATPPIPSNFEVEFLNPDGVDEQTARLTWTANAFYETEIFRSLDGGEFALLTTIAPNVGTYDDELMDGNEHTVEYYIRFKDDNTVLNAPINLAVAIIATGLRVTWDDNNTEADHIEIWSSLDDAAYSLVAAVEDGVETYDYAITNDKVLIKVRAKEGTLPIYSAYSDVVTFNPTYITEAQAVFTKITALSSTMTYARKALVNTYISAQKTAGLWDLTYAEWWLLEGSVKGRINMKSPDDYYLADVGTGAALTWVTDDCVYGSNVVSRGLNTGFNPTTVGVNKDNFAAHWYCKPSTLGGRLFGLARTSGNVARFWISAVQYFAHDATSKAYTPDHTQSGCLERSASNRVDLYRNGASVSNYTANSTNLPTDEHYLLNTNNDGSPITPTQAKMSHFAFTQKFTAQQHLDWVTNELIYLNGL